MTALPNFGGTASRKLDHIRICLDRDVEMSYRPFEDLMLVHRALPEIDLREVDLGTEFLGRRLKMPLMISAMTGGHPKTKEINVNLARAAQEVGAAMGVGSQRAALEDAAVEDTFSAVRDAAPDIPIVGNIGAAELCRGGPEIIERVAEMIDADAVAVHLNFLQESVQPEGVRDAKGLLDALRIAVGGPGKPAIEARGRRAGVPVMVKETGAGICREDAVRLLDSGIRIIDVAGAGGTSWSAAEAFRAEERGDQESRIMGELFRDWGIPTPVSVIECTGAGAEVIASGGIRSGIDVAKSLAIGAKVAGTALPLLEPATRGSEPVVRILREFERGLRISMFLTGCRDLIMLKSAPVVIAGRTRDILQERGVETNLYARDLR